MQGVVDTTTSLGAYEKEMQIGSGKEKRAQAMADRAVLDSQGGGQIKDLAQVQRGSPAWKLWTNFYSFANAQFQLTAESWRRTHFSDPAEVGRFASDMLMLYTVPAALNGLLLDALRQDWDEDESWPEYVARLSVQGSASQAIGTVPLLREFSGLIEGYYGIDGPAGARLLPATCRLGQ